MAAEHEAPVIGVLTDRHLERGDERRAGAFRSRWFRSLKLYGAGVLLVPLAFLLVSFHNLNDYGETSDENFDKEIGHFYSEEYPKTGLSKIEALLDPQQRNYGAFFDIVAVWTGNLLTAKTGWLKDPIAACHVAVVVASSLLLAAVFLLGVSAYGVACGYASQLALLLMPQFVGHSQNNLKDQPLTLFFTLAMLVFLAAMRRGSLWLWGLAGCLGGMAYAVKINGLLALPVMGVFAVPFALRQPRDIRIWALRFAVATAAYVATVPLLWPYYRTRTLARFAETFQAFRGHSFNEIVFYLGRHTPARDVPWHFPFVMFGVNTPLLQLGLTLLALAILAKLLLDGRLDEAAPLLLFAVWLFLPIIVQVASRVPRSDGIRHYLYVLPALALLAGTAAVRLWDWAEERRLGPFALRVAAAALPVFLLARTLVAYHPYEVVFFNSLVGGPAGARQKFELDYWGTSLLEASRWMEANLPAGSRLWFTQPGEHRFSLPNDLFIWVNVWDRPNFKISLPRGQVKAYDTDDDYLHPRRKPLYEVLVQGAPILQIFEMEENRDLPEGTILLPSVPEPTCLLSGLDGSLTVDNKADAPLPPRLQQKLVIEPAGNPYNNHHILIVGQGYLRVSDAGPHTFELLSDDAATLWLGGGTLMTNIAGHTTRKTVVLSPGLYPIRLVYRNEVGLAALRLRWVTPGSKDLRDLEAPDLSHEAGAPEPSRL